MANDTIYLARVGKPTTKHIISLKMEHVQAIRQDKHTLTIEVDKEVFEKLGFKC